MATKFLLLKTDVYHTPYVSETFISVTVKTETGDTTGFQLELYLNRSKVKIQTEHNIIEAAQKWIYKIG